MINVERIAPTSAAVVPPPGMKATAAARRRTIADVASGGQAHCSAADSAVSADAPERSSAGSASRTGSGAVPSPTAGSGAKR